MKLYDHVCDRGGRVTLQAIQQPPVEYKSALDIFQKVLEHEQHVTASIHKLYALAVKENDYPAQIALQWFVTEQVEEEKNAGLIVEQLKAVGESKTSLMLLDRASRQAGSVGRHLRRPPRGGGHTTRRGGVDDTPPRGFLAVRRRQACHRAASGPMVSGRRRRRARRCPRTAGGRRRPRRGGTSRVTPIPLRSSSPGQLAGLSPSSNPTARASSSRAPQASRRIPDHGRAPRHIAHGSVLVTSSKGGRPAPSRSWVPPALACGFACTATLRAVTREAVPAMRRTRTARSVHSSLKQRRGAPGPLPPAECVRTGKDRVGARTPGVEGRYLAHRSEAGSVVLATLRADVHAPDPHLRRVDDLSHGVRPEYARSRRAGEAQPAARSGAAAYCPTRAVR